MMMRCLDSHQSYNRLQRSRKPVDQPGPAADPCAEGWIERLVIRILKRTEEGCRSTNEAVQPADYLDSFKALAQPVQPTCQRPRFYRPGLSGRWWQNLT